ncbi:MAG: hypothetical protein WC763_03330 [Candidatus Paceibacterota bacterium]|jgi:hypothetical protein
MASWSNTRKYGYLTALIASIVIFVGVPTLLLLYRAPTCFDGKQNGGESGIDCGGACAKLCLADFAAPHILWSYSTRVAPGVFNAVAYVQNPNQSVQASSMRYLFRLYDDQGLLVAQRTGSAFIPAGQRLAVFEGGIQTGSRSPAKTTFEFTSDPEWRAGQPFTSLRVTFVDIATSTSPSAEVRVENQALDRGFSDITAILVLYDKDDNRVTFSKTVISKILPGGSEILYFTWPEAFPSDIVRSEVLFSAPGSR